MNEAQLRMSLGTNLTPKYSAITCPQRLPNRSITFQTPGKLLEMWRGMRRNTVICAKTHGLHLLVRKGSNLHLGSLRPKSRSRRSTITFRMVSATWRQLATAPCIRWKIISDPWIPMGNIYGGSKNRFCTTSERYHSATVTS